MPSFGSISESNIKGIHPDLEKVLREAIKETPVDFRVIDGLRTLAEQKVLVAKGASKTLRSRHLSGKAVDVMAIVNGKGRWEIPLYHRIAGHVLDVADKLDVDLTWGGSWTGFPDFGHFELNKNKYGY